MPSTSKHEKTRKNLTFIDPEPLYKLADRPEWLLGDEEGANKTKTQFTQDEVLFGLCSLTFYSEFNASMGIQLLYNIASAQPKVICERLFYPELRVERFLRKHNLPLFSLESKLAAQNFDILAFSIFHIPEFLNLLEMFDLSGLSAYKALDRLLNHERGLADDPLVIAGGIFTLNPEPIAEFFDVICIGEGDDWLVEFLAFYKKYRKLLKHDKRKFLETLAMEVEGTYVPILTKVSYNDKKGTITRTTNTNSQSQIRKRICDITRQPSTLLKPTIMSRTEKEAFTKAIEVARGCRWGCRFCVVTAFYRPYRERPLEVLKEVIDYRKTLGLKQIGVGAPTPPDYSRISELANYIIGQGLRFDIQSERMDTFSYESARAHVLSGRGNVSMAIEAPSYETRCQINKNLPEKTVMQAVTNGLKAGFRGIKLMFMLCHPWETKEQVKEFEPLLTKLFELREKHNPRCFFRVSVCPFIPKPWTTFQWAPLREAPELFKEANTAIESARRTPIGAHRFALQFAGGPTSRWMDTVFSRGDRRLADVFILVHTHGKPHNDMLYEFPYSPATKKCVSAIKGYCKALKIPIDKYVKGYNLDDDLPWDFIDIGIKKEWLRKDWLRAQQGKENPSCKDGCAGCGACSTYKDLDLPHPNSYQREPFKLDVTYRQFIAKRHEESFKNPRRRFTVYYTKNDKVTRLNFQDFRRLVSRCFQLAGYETDIRSIDCLSHQFYNGMSWSGTDIVDVQAYVPLDCDVNSLKEKLAPLWKQELGDISTLKIAGHSFKRDLEGITVKIDKPATKHQITNWLTMGPIIMIRTEHVSEKKSGEGVGSEHVNIRDYLLDLRTEDSLALIIDMKRGGNAYEYIQAFYKTDRKLAERTNVEILNAIMKESWEK